MSNDLILKAIESAKCRIYKLNFDTNGNISSHHQKKAENQKELMEVTVKALEQQLPQKPVLVEGFMTIAHCPVCNGVIAYKQDWCDKCGKKIDWSKERLSE